MHFLICGGVITSPISGLIPDFQYMSSNGFTPSDTEATDSSEVIYQVYDSVNDWFVSLTNTFKLHHPNAEDTCVNNDHQYGEMAYLRNRFVAV